MGSKRPCDGEDLMRLPFKHARSVVYDENVIPFSNVTSWVGAQQKDDALGCYYGSLCIPQHVEECKMRLNSADNISFMLEKDIETTAISSTVTSHLLEDESSQESDLHTVSFFFDHYPRKLVPIGQGHQADVPEWDPHIITESKPSVEATSASVDALNRYMDSSKDNVRKFMGTCVIPMPDLVENLSMESGHGENDCGCLDIGSIECVRQHVKVSRESLLKTLGRDIYVDLGFPKMGEEVAHGWSDEEQHVFREIVYTNPMSRGNNFWLCLPKMLPYRSQRELVSYYYNVLMLRVRATQNRSCELEVDSDDDEWQGEIPYSSVVHNEGGEDSQLESALDQDTENHSDDHDHIKYFVRNTIEGDDVSRVDSQFLHKDTTVTRGYQSSSRSLGVCGENFDSPSSGICASYMTDSFFTSESGSGSRHSEVSSTTSFRTEGSISGIGYGHGLFHDSHETLMWGIGTFTSGLDLLPTSNMIEEIFGSGSCDKKSSDDKHFS